ncbi:MAG: hypothetical protein RQ733_14065, partial [Methyloprofundus sp.]|nr:hypothetical protein [Methyloprofundus sp.]
IALLQRLFPVTLIFDTHVLRQRHSNIRKLQTIILPIKSEAVKNTPPKGDLYDHRHAAGTLSIDSSLVEPNRISMKAHPQITGYM